MDSNHAGRADPYGDRGGLLGLTTTLHWLCQDQALLTGLVDQTRREWGALSAHSRRERLRRIWTVKAIKHMRARTVLDYARLFARAQAAQAWTQARA